MGSSSRSTHRGLVHWQGLLLVASLLNFWSQPTTAQVTVESTGVVEGMDVTLRIHHKAPNTAGFLWYRGYTTDSNHIIAYLLEDPTIHLSGPPGGQAIVNHDGSLVLKNVTMKDAGIYTALVQLQGCQKMIACGRLDVYPFVSLLILIGGNTTVTENEDAVVFSCFTDAPTIQWLFNGANLQLAERLKLSHDHRNLTIDPVQREDAGYYQCIGHNPRISGESNTLKLDVKFE